MMNRVHRISIQTAALFAACSVLGLAATAVAQGKGKAPSKAKTETLTGFIGDTTCALTHISGGAKKCTVRCVQNMGAKYALVSGRNVYTLEGKEAELEKVAGERAKVTGTLQGRTMKVASVAPAHFEEAPHFD